MRLIDKSALVAEIERRIQYYSSEGCRPNSGKWIELISIKHFINTLEVKEVEEVDLEKEIDDWYSTMGIPVTSDALTETACHFFELGLKAQKGLD